MSLRPNPTDSTNPANPTPLDYVKYAVGIVVALLLVPAFLQGMLAFLQTFLQTLLSIVLTLNLLVLSAVAGVVGVWMWQRRAIAGVSETVTIEPSPVVPSLDQPPLASEYHDLEPSIDRLTERLTEQQAERSSRTIASPDTIVVTIPDMRSETPPPLTPSDKPFGNNHSSPEPLIQAQLARRLGVSSSTIGARKLKPDFNDWSSRKDPTGLAWRYCEEERLFVAESAAIEL